MENAASSPDVIHTPVESYTDAIVRQGAGKLNRLCDDLQFAANQPKGRMREIDRDAEEIVRQRVDVGAPN
jgi:hypothetical protein